MAQTELAQEFNKSAAAAYEAFPERLDKLVVLVTSSEEPVYVSPDIAEHLTKNVAAVKEAVNEVTDILWRNHGRGVSNRAYSMASHTVKLIAINEDPLPSVYSLRYTKEMHSIYTFDHEIGHLIVKNGQPSSISLGARNLAECAADAYAALRHIQRFGKKTDFFESYNKAGFIVLHRSPINYTDTVIQRVKQLSKETNIPSLSLHETAKLAGEIAVQYRINEKKLKKIDAAFAVVRNAREEHVGDEAVCKATLLVMKKHIKDTDIFMTGKLFLSRPARKEFMEDLAQTDVYWKNALEFLAKSGKQDGASPHKGGPGT